MSKLLVLLGVIAQQYAQPNSHIYDLGCSLRRLPYQWLRSFVEQVHYVCVDNSPAMTSRCQQILQRHLPTERFTLL